MDWGASESSCRTALAKAGVDAPYLNTAEAWVLSLYVIHVWMACSRPDIPLTTKLGSIS